MKFRERRSHPCDILVDDGPLVVAELAVAQARNDPAGSGDERMAGGDQVQELHRPVDPADRRGDRAGLLEVFAGLLAPLKLGHAPRGGNRQLKRAMFLSAFACMNADPASRAYYDRQRARGKTHTQALLRLARQRISVLFAMLRDGTFYESRTPHHHPRCMTT